MRANELTNISGSALKMPLYHGTETTTEFAKFRRPPEGVFFTPHKDWAEDHYGSNIITCYVWAPKVYMVPNDDLLDALFDRDYDTVAKYVIQMQQQGYHALQTTTESEMVSAFSNARIYSATTGAEM